MPHLVISLHEHKQTNGKDHPYWACVEIPDRLQHQPDMLRAVISSLLRVMLDLWEVWRETRERNG